MKCNTVTFESADGKSMSFSLPELLDRQAVLASKVGGEDIVASMGGFNQLWIPGWPAKYFVRDIVSIRFSEEEKVPEVKPFEDDGHDYTNRPNVSVKAPYIGHLGEPMKFEGYASDYDRSITGVHFSLDEGKTWTKYRMENTSPERWVYWEFVYTPLQVGRYVMRVRAEAEDGTVSPLAATHAFEVID